MPLEAGIRRLIRSFSSLWHLISALTATTCVASFESLPERERIGSLRSTEP